MAKLTGMRERCIERGIGEILLYVGGNLVIGKQNFSEIEKKFRDMGFNRVFFPDSNLEDMCAIMHEDISHVLNQEGA